MSLQPETFTIDNITCLTLAKAKVFIFAEHDLSLFCLFSEAPSQIIFVNKPNPMLETTAEGLSELNLSFFIPSLLSVPVSPSSVDDYIPDILFLKTFGFRYANPRATVIYICWLTKKRFKERRWSMRCLIQNNNYLETNFNSKILRLIVEPSSSVVLHILKRHA